MVKNRLKITGFAVEISLALCNRIFNEIRLSADIKLKSRAEGRVKENTQKLLTKLNYSRHSLR